MQKLIAILIILGLGTGLIAGNDVKTSENSEIESNYYQKTNQSVMDVKEVIIITNEKKDAGKHFVQVKAQLKSRKSLWKEVILPNAKTFFKSLKNVLTVSPDKASNMLKTPAPKQENSIIKIY